MGRLPVWQRQDRKILKRINAVIEDIGKPEALKHDFAGYWSRRITQEHRLVYKVVGVLTNLGDYQDSKHLHIHVHSGTRVR